MKFACELTATAASFSLQDLKGTKDQGVNYLLRSKGNENFISFPFLFFFSLTERFNPIQKKTIFWVDWFVDNNPMLDSG